MFQVKTHRKITTGKLTLLSFKLSVQFRAFGFQNNFYLRNKSTGTVNRNECVYTCMIHTIADVVCLCLCLCVCCGLWKLYSLFRSNINHFGNLPLSFLFTKSSNKNEWCITNHWLNVVLLISWLKPILTSGIDLESSWIIQTWILHHFHNENLNSLC